MSDYLQQQTGCGSGQHQHQHIPEKDSCWDPGFLALLTAVITLAHSLPSSPPTMFLLHTLPGATEEKDKAAVSMGSTGAFVQRKEIQIGGSTQVSGKEGEETCILTHQTR